MLEKIRSRISPIVEKLVSKLPPYPNYYTILSLVITSLAFTLLVLNYITLTLVILLYIIAALLDMIDGAVARIHNLVSSRGALLDSVIDRYVDFIITCTYIVVLNNVLMQVLVLATILGSFMTSYIRARSESLGLKLSGVGIFERAERLILLISGLILYKLLEVELILYIVLTILAFGTNLTAIHRLVYSFRKLR